MNSKHEKIQTHLSCSRLACRLSRSCSVAVVKSMRPASISRTEASAMSLIMQLRGISF